VPEDRLIAGRFRLEEKVGVGGMGVVWRATDIELGRVVALKRSHSGDSGQTRREARIGAGLHHPHVVTVFDAVLDGDDRWLVMEYLPSRSVAAILAADGPIPPARVAHIGAQIADALAAMHATAVVHRDITPSNVLVAEDGTAKLTDLGIARWAEATVTGGAQLGGSSGYMAPEVAEGYEAGFAADVFALGATLFAAVEGSSPWGGAENGPLAQLRRAAAFQMEPMRHAASLGPALTTLMSREPSRRPTAPQARALLDGTTPAAVRPADPARTPSARPGRPRRAPVLAAVAVVGVLAAAALGATLLTGPRAGPSDQVDSAGPALTGPASAVGALGDPTTADPCSLLVPEALSRFGKAYLEPNYGNFNHCGVIIDLPDAGGNVEVAAELLSPEQNPPRPPLPGRLGQVERPDPEPNRCARSISLPTLDRVVISARQVQRKPADLCAMADSAALAAYGELNQGPIPRRPGPFPAGSAAGVDACSLLRPPDLAPVLGPDTTPEPRYGRWGCDWGTETHRLGYRDTLGERRVQPRVAAGGRPRRGRPPGRPRQPPGVPQRERRRRRPVPRQDRAAALHPGPGDHRGQPTRSRGDRRGRPRAHRHPGVPAGHGDQPGPGHQCPAPTRMTLWMPSVADPGRLTALAGAAQLARWASRVRTISTAMAISVQTMGGQIDGPL
jgi:hypothetical protein